MLPYNLFTHEPFDIKDGLLKRYNGSSEDVVIPEGVTEIKSLAFAIRRVKSITFSQSVQKIDSTAFLLCNHFREINVPESNEYFTSVDGVLFDKNKTTIVFYPPYKTDESYTIPEGVTTIAEYAFDSSLYLTTISIPDSVTKICKHAFSGANKITKITLPERVKELDGTSFSDCKSLAEIKISANNSYYTIIDNVLLNKEKNKLILYPANKSNSDYSVPESVTEIGDFAFSGCENLKNIIISNTVTSIGEGAFSGCERLFFVKIPDGITEIKFNTFYGCRLLTTVILPDSITHIGNSTFEECINLEDVILPDNLKIIGDRAFSECHNLKTIKLPKGIEKIGDNAFETDVMLSME